MGHRWGRDGPPPEAYSRVTNPERFAVLHEVAEREIDALAARPRVEIREELDGEDRVVRIVPPSGCAPITVTFTPFPGVVVRAGNWLERSFPSCGCDACDEDPDENSADLRELIDAVVAGRFIEELRVPRLRVARVRDAHFSNWISGERSRWGTSAPVRGATLRELRARGEPGRYGWPPWP